jgi:4-hydroxybenzoate polyprenyltransferase
LIYDTIYAHQDKADDIKIGVKSTALAWGEHTKTIMQGLAAVQLGLFWYAGLSAGLGLPYFPACIAAHLYLWRLI